jgi:hypothetical protein
MIIDVMTFKYSPALSTLSKFSCLWVGMGRYLTLYVGCGKHCRRANIGVGVDGKVL